MTKVAVAMLGARMHYAVPRLLYEAGMLDRFFTDNYVGNKPWLERFLRMILVHRKSMGVQRWLGRVDAVIPSEKVVSFDALGLWYVFSRARAKTDLERELVYCEAARRFSKLILKTGLGDASIVWGFNSSALELFQAAKASGRICILEQTILPRELEIKLLADEARFWPGWQPSMIALGDLGSPMIAIERQEWELADRIVAGSAFVSAGLIECGVPPAKIKVVSYGIDVDRFALRRDRMCATGGPLKVLFAGEVGLRKGVPYLLQALARIGPDKITARFAGSIAIERSKLRPFAKVAEFLGPVPRSQMLALYKWADVFALPSIVEGSATVTYEALLSEIPVITTPNAGSIVRDGLDGRVVHIRDVTALVEVLEIYANDRNLLLQHSRFSENNKYRASLKRYGNDLYDIVRGLV